MKRRSHIFKDGIFRISKTGILKKTNYRGILKNLYKAQEILERDGVIEGKIHRFYIAARKR